MFAVSGLTCSHRAPGKRRASVGSVVVPTEVDTAVTHVSRAQLAHIITHALYRGMAGVHPIDR
jgi:hypothetical protein